MVGNGSFLHILKIITDYRNSQLFFVDCCILLKFDNFFVRSVLDGIFAGDGAEQDVYLFGMTEPVQEYSGKVIAVYHRLNDVEDKWIVALDGTKENYSDEEILDAIAFQEQYFVGELYR